MILTGMKKHVRTLEAAKLVTTEKVGRVRHVRLGPHRLDAEAASDLGASPWETFRRVTLPLILPGIVAGALLVFTLSIDDYVVTSFVAGVGATTLPIQIYSMLKVGVTPEVNAVSTLLLLLTVVLIALAQRLQQDPHAVPRKGARKK